MESQPETNGRSSPGEAWYARSADDVLSALGTDVATGLPAGRAAELLAAVVWLYLEVLYLLARLRNG